MDSATKVTKMFGRTWARAAGTLAAFAALLGASIAGAVPVAMVSDLQGNAAFVSAGARRPLAMLSEIEPNAQVELQGGARVVALYLNGSGEYVLNGPSVVAFDSQQPRSLKGSAPQKRAVLGGKAGDVRLKSVGATQGALVMRSAKPGGRIALISPSGGRALVRPQEFRWALDAPGASYHFELVDDRGNVVYETDVAMTSLQLPSSVSLSATTPYSWTVSTRSRDGRKFAATGEFSIVADEVRRRITAVRPASGAPVSDRVAYAAWLEQLELRDEAREVWRALAVERPQESRFDALARE